jgi:hypothetical protein
LKALALPLSRLAGFCIFGAAARFASRFGGRIFTSRD